MKQPELGHKVLELRQSRGLTQSELAESCNLSLRTIQRIEALEATPRNYTIKAIFECLGYDLDDLSSDTPNIKAEEVDRDNWIKRSLKYVQELFNLKTNTMKKLRVLSLFAVLLFAGIFVTNTTINAQQNKEFAKTTESLEGIWQKVILDPLTYEVRAFIPFIKVFNADGTFVHMQVSSRGPAFFNAVGTWEVTSANTYLEHVKPSNSMIERTEQQTFMIQSLPSGIFMHSKFHTVGTHMQDIKETWFKCGFPNYNRQQK